MKKALSVFLVLWRSIAIAWASTILEDRYFDSDGVHIRYVEQGACEPIVLVHGYTSGIEHNWTNTGVLQALSHPQFLPTLRGFLAASSASAAEGKLVTPQPREP